MNIIKTIQNDVVSEEEWDFEATYAVEEDISEEEEWDFEATYPTKEDVSEDEWDLTEHNIDDVWIEDLRSDEGIEIAASVMIVEQDVEERVDDQSKQKDCGKRMVPEFVLGHKEIELVAT